MNWATTCILGGGPSAAEIYTAALPGVVLGVNNAAFYKPCHAFFSNDHNYARGIRGQIEAYPRERHLAVRSHHMHQFKGWDARLWRRIDERDPRTDGSSLSSGPPGTPGCSGYVALNLAAQMGARLIILLGFDFHDTYTYFFDAAPFPRVSVPEVRQSFRDVAPWYARQGVRIVNVSPDSSIDAFPRMTLAEVLAPT